jgi:hypothetical protein
MMASRALGCGDKTPLRQLTGTAFRNGDRPSIWFDLPSQLTDLDLEDDIGALWAAIRSIAVNAIEEHIAPYGRSDLAGKSFEYDAMRGSRYRRFNVIDCRSLPDSISAAWAKK